jgi:hypothetical protein
MARRTLQVRTSVKGKLLTWLAAAVLIYWIARDPAGAAHFARHVGDGFARFARNLHHGRTTRP